MKAAAAVRPLRIAILGAGFVADFYLRALRHVRGHDVVVIMARSADKGATRDVTRIET